MDSKCPAIVLLAFLSSDIWRCFRGRRRGREKWVLYWVQLDGLGCNRVPGTWWHHRLYGHQLRGQYQQELCHEHQYHHQPNSQPLVFRSEIVFECKVTFPDFPNIAKKKCLQFVLGTALVVYATYLYAMPETRRSRPPPINIIDFEKTTIDNGFTPRYDEDKQLFLDLPDSKSPGFSTSRPSSPMRHHSRVGSSRGKIKRED